MKVLFPCGKNDIELDIPQNVRILESNTSVVIKDPRKAVETALKNPVNSPGLAELAGKSKNACIVVSDITRPVPNKTILPCILDALAQGGIQKQDVTVLIATGMHRPNLGDELIELIGEDLAKNVKVINHDCLDQNSMSKVDEIQGYPIELNKTFLDADLKILTGLIEPHTFAGFSGGAKSVLPGVASFKSMELMHSFAMIQNPKLKNCRIKDNPFQEYVRRIAQKAQVDFIVNVLIDKDRNMVEEVFAGELTATHDKGCAKALHINFASIEEPCDLAITSGGGYPLDQTFYQATKGLISAYDLVKPHGEVLFLADCASGIGSSELIEMLSKYKTPESFLEHFSDPKNFTIDQWGAQRFYQCRKRFAKIHLYAPGLSSKDHEILKTQPVSDPQRTLNDLIKNNKKIIAMPEGPYMVGGIEKIPSN